MRDTMILIARMMSDTRIERLNQEMIKFGKTRGLWCKDGIMMNPSKENLEHMLDLMKQKNITILLTESRKELRNRMDLEMVDESLKKHGISCLCREENIVLGIEDDSLLVEHKPKAILVYEDESEVDDMRSYIEEKGYEVESVSKQTCLKDEELDKLIEDILVKDIDAVVMPTADYFNAEDYTTPLVFALYEHGIQVHVAEFGANINDVLKYKITHRKEEHKEKLNGQSMIT